MYPSKAAAEKAAVDGTGGVEFDTQQCLALQEDILSSSPRGNETQSNHVAWSLDEYTHSHFSASAEHAFDSNSHRNPELIETALVEQLPIEPKCRAEPLVHSTVASIITGGKDANASSSVNIPRTEHIIQTLGNTIRRTVPESVLPPLVVETGKGKTAAMDDFTQKSSLSALSPTQQNSESVYERYNNPLDETREENPIGRTQESAPDFAVGSLAKHQSIFTESTAHTYGENDTGHVQFDTFIPEVSVDFDDNISQDASFAPREEPTYEHVYEPQTPALPVNPFAHKGSVLKGHELFEATQPSSYGRHLTSAISASSRPSPNIYDDFTSPVKRTLSSPLAGRIDDSNTSPLHSSVRELLRSRSNDVITQQPVPIFRALGIQSFDVGPRPHQPNTIREPRPYVSMKESQELRRRETESSSAGSGSEAEFSDIDDVPRKRLMKRKREQQAKEEMSKVVKVSASASKALHSGGKVLASSPEIVVPSTGRKGRRRSTQDEYVAQLEDHDARDTQQDDVIADSQVEVLDKEAQPSTAFVSDHTTESASTHKSNIEPSPASPTSLFIEDANTDLLDVEDNSTVRKASSTSNDVDLPTPRTGVSLPLQEVSTNLVEVRTPSGTKNQVYSDAADSTVPETSPAEEDRLRPMRDIASLSFGESQTEPLGDIPGFSQDVEFDEAIRPISSLEATPRKPRATRIPLFPISKEVVTEQKPAILSRRTIEPVPHLEEPIPEGASSGIDHSGVGNKGMSVAGEDHLDEGTEINEPELPELQEIAQRRGGLRTQAELKGPSKSLRRNVDKPLQTYATPRQSTRITKSSSTATNGSSKRAAGNGIMSTPLSSLTTLPSSSDKSTPSRSSARRSTRNVALSRDPTPLPSTSATKNPGSRLRNLSVPIPVPAPVKSFTKRKSTAVVEPVPTRASKRKSITKAKRDSSADPLAGPAPVVTAVVTAQEPIALFTDMAFAVSYVGHQDEKDDILQLIKNGGGEILSDGFDSLFDFRSSERDGDLTLCPSATRITFTGLIADEHSRRAKYMQALALNLPCISGRWISACVSKGEVINWAPYLLCAGQSSFLGNAIRSRTIVPYHATNANFVETFEKRERLLDGKSILLVTGKGRGAEEKRKAYVFLTRALGPTRLEQVQDLDQARKRLYDSESVVDGETQVKWDLLYVDSNESAAENVVFGSGISSTASKKRKRAVTVTQDTPTPAPKKIRIINDEVVIQSLILGEFLESPLP